MKSILILKIVIGFMALSLGAVGMFLPVMPTTPFLLVAVGCFSSTPTMQRKVLHIPFVKEYYDSYKDGKGIKKQTLGFSLSFLWIMLFISMFVTQKISIVVLLAIVGIGVSVHLVYLTKRGD